MESSHPNTSLPTNTILTHTHNHATPALHGHITLWHSREGMLGSGLPMLGSVIETRSPHPTAHKWSWKMQEETIWLPLNNFFILSFLTFITVYVL